jgi:DNA-binding transcriptional regulator YiaG
MAGDEVLAIRQRLQLSQAELAEKLGTSERTVRRWEREGCPEIVARFLKSMEEEK